MQTFLAFSSFKKSAQVLDAKRLGKERVETKQILQVLDFGPYQKWPQGTINSLLPCSEEEFANRRLFGVCYRKTPWYFHPAVQMWKGFEPALAHYGAAICTEWRSRGYQDNQLDYFRERMTDSYTPPPWLGDERFHSSHRGTLLFKNPVWYGQFGWTEKPEYRYWWPSQHSEEFLKKSS